LKVGIDATSFPEDFHHFSRSDGKMPVLTIYNHGTGGTSLKPASKLEIVNLFGNMHRDSNPQGKYREWIITEGVGSKGDPAHHTITFDPKTGQLNEQNVAPSMLAIKALRRVFESATGAGVQNNVQNVVAVLRSLKAANQMPTAINMIGWSRGAVTCIRIAYELFKDATIGAGNIPVNIFAVDPVAGGSANLERQGNILFPNVRTYIGILATGERREAFAPKTQMNLQVASPSITRTAFLHFPGIHSDVAKWNAEQGFIVFHLCSRFLEHFETIVPQQHNFQKPIRQLLQYYFNLAMKEKRTGLISSTQKNGKTKFKQGKWSDKNTGVGDWIKGGGGYQNRNLQVDQVSGDGEDALVNVHHEMLFRQAFPNLYRHCFDSRLPIFEWQMGFDRNPVRAELDTVDLYAPGVENLLRLRNRTAQRADEQSWAGVLAGCEMF
jgi:hypothetical protein